MKTTVLRSSCRMKAARIQTSSVRARSTCAATPISMLLSSRRQTIYGGVMLDGQTCYMAAGKANDRSFIRYLNKLKKTVRQDYHYSRQRRLPQLWVRTAIPRGEQRLQTDIPAAVLAVFESGRMAVTQRQGVDTAHLQAAGQELFQAGGDARVRIICNNV